MNPGDRVDLRPRPLDSNALPSANYTLIRYVFSAVKHSAEVRPPKQLLACFVLKLFQFQSMGLS
jgi:hypothetical protein